MSHWDSVFVDPLSILGLDNDQNVIEEEEVALQQVTSSVILFHISFNNELDGTLKVQLHVDLGLDLLDLHQIVHYPLSFICAVNNRIR